MTIGLDTAAAILDLDHTKAAQNARTNRCLLIIMVIAGGRSMSDFEVTLVRLGAYGALLETGCQVEVANTLVKNKRHACLPN